MGDLSHVFARAVSGKVHDQPLLGETFRRDEEVRATEYAHVLYAQDRLTREAGNINLKASNLSDLRDDADRSIAQATKTVTQMESEKQTGWCRLLNTSMLTTPAAIIGAAFGAIGGAVVGAYKGIEAVTPESPEGQLAFLMTFPITGPILYSLGAAGGALAGSVYGAGQGFKIAGLKTLNALTPEGEKTYFEAASALSAAREDYRKVADNHAKVYESVRENMPPLVEMVTDLKRAAKQVQSPLDIKGVLTSLYRQSSVARLYKALESEISRMPVLDKKPRLSPNF